MAKKIKNIILRHMGMILGIIVCGAIVVYFVNIIFIQNKTDVLSVLILTTEADSGSIRGEIEATVKTRQGEEIVIQTVDYDDKINQGAVITWIRSGTIDLVIGNEEQMTWLGQRGYLEKLDQTGIQMDDRKFMCGTASLDDEGNILSVQGNDWVGVYREKPEEASPGKAQVASILKNAHHKENGVKALEAICGG